MFDHCYGLLRLAYLPFQVLSFPSSPVFQYFFDFLFVYFIYLCVVYEYESLLSYLTVVLILDQTSDSLLFMLDDCEKVARVQPLTVDNYKEEGVHLKVDQAWS